MASQPPPLNPLPTSVPLPANSNPSQQPISADLPQQQPAFYLPHAFPNATRSISSSRVQPVARHPQQSGGNNNTAAISLDPTPGEPDVVFIRAPFTSFPGASEHKNGLAYNLLAANPNWFLDVNDFVGPNAIVYPSNLEPPRGWCPTKKKDAKDGWKEGEEPRLRCTLCRRHYAGVNAKSMWRRHVYEKHKIAMANRREINNERPGGRGGRSSNKENKASTSRTADKDQTARPSTKTVRRVVSLEIQASTSSTAHTTSIIPLQDAVVDNSNNNDDDSHPQSSGEDENLTFTEGPSFSSTPPHTPRSPLALRGMPPEGDEDSFTVFVPPESPYNPLMTPAFRHSPARLPNKQPWKIAPKSGEKVRDYTLAMLARGEASPNVRGLDVSPIVLVPASERQKRSIYSSPRTQSASALSMSPRRLFADLEEESSIQSRMDQPGWDIPLAPGPGLLGEPMPNEEDQLPPGDHEYNVELIVRQLVAAGVPDPRAPTGFVSTPNRKQNKDDEDIDYLSWPHESAFASPFHSAQFTPHTKMFINGIVSPIKGPDSSPCPSNSPGPSAGNRSRRATISDSVVPRFEPSPLLPAFPVTLHSEVAQIGMDVDDIPSEISELDSPTKVRECLPSWRDLFNPGPASGVRPDFDVKDTSSFSLSSSTSSLSSSRSGCSTSSSWRATSPSRSIERHRARSGSNAGASTSVLASGSSSGHKHSVGLMDAVLGNKSSRRKHGHSEHRGDGDFGVTAMGSPFKMGKKTSRREFLYSNDGDCEMQDAQPRKRRKTISGRD